MAVNPYDPSPQHPAGTDQQVQDDAAAYLEAAAAQHKAAQDLPLPIPTTFDPKMAAHRREMLQMMNQQNLTMAQIVAWQQERARASEQRFLWLMAQKSHENTIEERKLLERAVPIQKVIGRLVDFGFDRLFGKH